MKHDLNDIYEQKFFRKRHQYHWRWPFVCGAINWMWLGRREGGPIRTVIDLGAATGDLVKGFLALDMDAWGVEGSRNCLPYIVCPEERMAILDLRDPLRDENGWFIAGWPERFDLVTCWEVAEHLEPEFAEQFVQNLCDLSDRILMSACPPSGRKSSGSVGHFHEMPYEYWVGMFGEHGYRRIERKEAVFKNIVAPFRGRYGIKAFYENVLYFEIRR